MRKNPRPIKLNYMRPVHFAERFTEFMLEIMGEAKDTPYWNMPFDDIVDEYQMNNDDWFDDLDEGEGYPHIKLIDVLEEGTVFFNYGGGVVDFDGNEYNIFQIPVEFQILPTKTDATFANKSRLKDVVGGGYWSPVNAFHDENELVENRYRLSQLKIYMGAPRTLWRKHELQVKLLELKDAQNGLLVLKQKLLGTPELMYNILTKYKAQFIARKASTLVHEFTHVRDISSVRNYVSADKDYTQYANHPQELAAFIQESVFRLWYDLVYVNPWKWDDELKSVFHRWNLENVFEEYLDEANFFRKSRYRYLTQDNKNRVLSAMVQFLRENGFDLPPRRLYTEADFEEDSEF